VSYFSSSAVRGGDRSFRVAPTLILGKRTAARRKSRPVRIGDSVTCPKVGKRSGHQRFGFSGVVRSAGALDAIFRKVRNGREHDQINGICVGTRRPPHSDWCQAVHLAPSALPVHKRRATRFRRVLLRVFCWGDALRRRRQVSQSHDGRDRDGGDAEITAVRRFIVILLKPLMVMRAQ